jgi:addiction module HigA family antidote
MPQHKLSPIHPREVLLEEFLVPLGVSQYRLSKDIHVPPRRINEIVRGMRAISADTALRRLHSLERERAARTALESFLSRLPLPTMLLRWNLRLIYQNKAAREFCNLWAVGPELASLTKADGPVPAEILDRCHRLKNDVDLVKIVRFLLVVGLVLRGSGVQLELVSVGHTLELDATVLICFTGITKNVDVSTAQGSAGGSRDSGGHFESQVARNKPAANVAATERQ